MYSGVRFDIRLYVCRMRGYLADMRTHMPPQPQHKAMQESSRNLENHMMRTLLRICFNVCRMRGYISDMRAHMPPQGLPAAAWS
jgi:hypothetical protein